MPTVDLPGMRSISTDSACMARQRSSARPGDLAVLHAGVGLELEGRDHGAGMDLRDLAFDRELAALLLELPRGVHQLALVDLALGLRRVEQRQRRQREGAVLPLRGRLGGSGSGSGSGGVSGRLARDDGRRRPRRRCRRRARAIGRARASGSPRRRRAASAFGARPPSWCAWRSPRAARVRACARRASRGASRRRAPTGPASSTVARREHPAERELRRQDHRQHHQREQDDDRAGAVEIVGRARCRATAPIEPPASKRLAGDVGAAEDQAEERARRRRRAARRRSALV